MDRDIDTMQTAYKTPPLSLTGHPAAELDVDLLVIPAFVDDDFVDEPDLDRASGGEIGRARARGEFTGKPYEVLVTALSGWKALRAVIVGAGQVHGGHARSLPAHGDNRRTHRRGSAAWHESRFCFDPARTSSLSSRHRRWPKASFSPTTTVAPARQRAGAHMARARRHQDRRRAGRDGQNDRARPNPG